MVMGVIWALLVALATAAAALTGRLSVLSPALMEGAEAAVRLAFSLAGALCLWSGLATLMEKAGFLHSLA